MVKSNENQSDEGGGTGGSTPPHASSPFQVVGLSTWQAVAAMVVIAAVVTGISFVAIALLGRGEDGQGLAQVPPFATAPSPAAQEFAQPIVRNIEPSVPATLESRDGEVRIEIPEGATDRPLVLIYEALSEEQLPELGGNYVAGHAMFDLTAFTSDNEVIEDLVFSEPIKVTFDVPPELLAMAGYGTSAIAIQHYRELVLGGTVQRKTQFLRELGGSRDGD